MIFLILYHLSEWSLALPGPRNASKLTGVLAQCMHAVSRLQEGYGGGESASDQRANL
jgi:hypothetical protein